MRVSSLFEENLDFIRYSMLTVPSLPVDATEFEICEDIMLQSLSV